MLDVAENICSAPDESGVGNSLQSAGWARQNTKPAQEDPAPD
jgi:hypothetical protein